MNGVTKVERRNGAQPPPPADPAIEGAYESLSETYKLVQRLSAELLALREESEREIGRLTKLRETEVARLTDQRDRWERMAEKAVNEAEQLRGANDKLQQERDEARQQFAGLQGILDGVAAQIAQASRVSAARAFGKANLDDGKPIPSFLKLDQGPAVQEGRPRRDEPQPQPEREPEPQLEDDVSRKALSAIADAMGLGGEQ